jgi:hypothetical protein
MPTPFDTHVSTKHLISVYEMEKIGRERVYVLIFYQTPKSRFDIKRWTAHVIDGGLTATRLRNLKRRFSQTNQYRENKRRKRIHHHVCREVKTELDSI